MGGTLSGFARGVVQKALQFRPDLVTFGLQSRDQYPKV
jgi:hypothetical protein